MGGFGSGRSWRYDSKTTVEECLELDINYLNREGLLKPGRRSSITWSRNGKEIGSITVEVYQNYVELKYTVDQEEKFDYRVQLDRVEMNLGGYKPYFRCRSCGSRREKLYLSSKSDYFLCRECLDLTYKSCQQSGDRAATIRRKLRKLYKQLDSEWKGVAYSRIPDKPKNMHYETYWEIKKKIISYERELDRLLMQKVEQLKNF